MNERSKMISKLLSSRETREAYIRSKLSVLLPSQIRSLRLRRGMKQSELGEAAAMKQARISSMERIGEAKFSVETLVRLAAAFRVGIEVRFVEFSEMLAWENEYQPDHFDVFPLEKDENFISPRVRDEQIKVDGGIWFATTAQDNTLNSSKASQISNIEGRSVLDQQSHFPLADMKSISIGASA